MFGSEIPLRARPIWDKKIEVVTNYNLSSLSAKMVGVERVNHVKRGEHGVL